MLKVKENDGKEVGNFGKVILIVMDVWNGKLNLFEFFK